MGSTIMIHTRTDTATSGMAASSVIAPLSTLTARARPHITPVG